MDLPIISTPLFPRWVWMEEVTYSHIPIATIVTAFLFLAPIFEYIGWRLKDLRYDRLAKSLVFFAMILFSPGAALGTGIVMFIIGLYPEFWSRWSNLFFGPLMAQFVFFTLDVIFLFFCYYLPWDRMMNRKRLHIFFGGLTAMFGLLIQAVWDGLGSYMLTPGVPLPGVNEPVGWSAQAFFNPSFLILFLHRFFGNISYTMLLVGGVLGLKYMRAKDKKEKSYFGFASDITFSLGILAFFAMPFIGWIYATIIKNNAPVAFHALMSGHTSKIFTVKMVLIGIFLFIAATYLFIRHRRKILFLVAVTIAITSLYIVFHLHPPLDWLGSPLAWQVAYTVLLAGFLIFLWIMRTKAKPVTEKGWPWLMLIAGLAAFLTFGIGGYIREHSKTPYTVYNQLQKPEVTTLEADRFLFYEKCVDCHHKSPKDILRYKTIDWKERMEIEQNRPGVEISDEEASRIISYLQEIRR